jgi:hypothetical protein
MPIVPCGDQILAVARPATGPREDRGHATTRPA